MKTRTKKIIGWSVVALIVAALIVGIILTDGLYTNSEDISEVMQDAVLHEENTVDIFGFQANPGLVSAYLVTIILLVAAALIRIFAIPKFKRVPGKFQLAVESIVGWFDRLAKTNSPHRNSFLGAYIFGAGCYIFAGTLFELVGAAAVSAAGNSVVLPAPLSDINGAIAMGFLSYFVILSGGIVSNGLRGVGRTLKDFSLPISMSFRLSGALLSGLLVSELVYYYIALSFVLPVIVGVLFTLLHALIQTYVLVMLTSLFYGEVSEPYVKVPKAKKKKARAAREKQ